ncbi:hypothetical protein BpHYR1_052673 [Brachionus plicatilis]|uniref:Uncharacterized protein n=1 Tax=Brachionus plicatilis TaxID=10195 RepID=A0A3M7QF96_BRAPC|nr:hypothetical protein BpHYR1_052673 [Brachionus plicatilis]
MLINSRTKFLMNNLFCKNLKKEINQSRIKTTLKDHFPIYVFKIIKEKLVIIGDLNQLSVSPLVTLASTKSICLSSLVNFSSNVANFERHDNSKYTLDYSSLAEFVSAHLSMNQRWELDSCLTLNQADYCSYSYWPRCKCSEICWISADADNGFDLSIAVLIN